LDVVNLINFLVDTILGILPDESYSSIRALVDLSVCIKIYQHASSAVVPHLDRTGKPSRPSRCNINQRRLPSLASSARRRVTMKGIAP